MILSCLFFNIYNAVLPGRLPSGPPAEPKREADALLEQGLEATRRRDLPAALAFLTKAQALYHNLGDRRGEAAALGCQAIVHDDAQEPDQAVRCYADALRCAQALPPPPWSGKASLSFLAAGGNARSQSFGLSDEGARHWGSASTLTFLVSMARVATRTSTVLATGTSASSYTLATQETSQVTTDDVLANARFARDFTARLQWFCGAGWERNPPAGISSRTQADAGLGYWWVKAEDRKLRTDVGLGYARAEPVTWVPGFQVHYATCDAAASFEQKEGPWSFRSNLSCTVQADRLANVLIVWRSDLSLDLRKRLALRLGYTLTYNNRPASAAVPVVEAGSAPPVVVGQAFTPLLKLDTLFTTSLVLSF